MMKGMRASGGSAWACGGTVASAAQVAVRLAGLRGFLGESGAAERGWRTRDCGGVRGVGVAVAVGAAVGVVMRVAVGMRNATICYLTILISFPHQRLVPQVDEGRHTHGVHVRLQPLVSRAVGGHLGLRGKRERYILYYCSRITVKINVIIL